LVLIYACEFEIYNKQGKEEGRVLGKNRYMRAYSEQDREPKRLTRRKDKREEEEVAFIGE
jgi:hypothetical protein